MARELILGTAGHIDHGKTALVRALTGVDTDRLPHEKERGITIDIGFARLDAGDARLGIVDVPGHERFIKNMLAGACGVDVALLVVAADDSVMPQTREHLAILELLGVERGVVAITKSDLADEDWLELVEDEVRALAAGTFMESAAVVRTSARTGAGLGALRNAIAEAARAVEDAPLDEPFRLAIDRSFIAAGRGTVVTGTVWSGSLRLDDEVELLPQARRVRVREIQRHDEPVETAGRAQRAAINLAGVHHREVRRGHELATPGVLAPATRMGARLRLLPDAPRPLKHRARVRLHVGTGETIAGVRLLDTPGPLAPGDTALVELACAEPVVGAAGQAFVIRAESPVVTIGGGTILQAPSRVRRRNRASVARLGEIECADPVRRASGAIASLGPRPWTRIDLWQACGLWGEAAESMIAELVSRGDVVPVGSSSMPVHARTLEALSHRVRRTLERLHDANPLQTRFARRRLGQSMPDLGPDLLDGAIERMLESGELEGDASGVALPGRGPALSQAQQRVRRAWLEQSRAGAFSPPDPAAIGRACGVDEDEARRVADVCVRLGELERISDNIFLHTDRRAELVERVRDALEHTDGLTVSRIKDLLGTSRKYAVPICEYLDRAGVTTRRGDVRVLAARVGTPSGP